MYSAHKNNDDDKILNDKNSLECICVWILINIHVLTVLCVTFMPSMQEPFVATPIQYTLLEYFSEKKKIKRFKLEIYKYLNSVEWAQFHIHKHTHTNTKPVRRDSRQQHYGPDFSNDGHTLCNGCNLKPTT